MYFNKQDLPYHFNKIYFNFDDIDLEELCVCNSITDYAPCNFIKGDFFLELIPRFKERQQKSFKFLSGNHQFFYAIKKSKIRAMKDIHQFGVIVNDMVFYIKYSPNQSLFCENIPLELVESWLYHCSAWFRADSIASGVWKSNMPNRLLYPLNSTLNNFYDKESFAKNCDFIECKFNHLFRKDYQNDIYNDTDKYFELRCLLDTRDNDDYSQTGFQLFVSSHNKERNVYVVPNADVFQIKQLDNPADAIDSYAAHIFSRQKGEFDFMQYAKDF